MMGTSQLVTGQVVKSCGGSGDILSNAVISTDPSPIDKKKPFTLTATGTLTDAVTAGNVDVNLNVKALGIINEPVTANVDFTYSPGVAKGDSKLVVGPLTFPSALSSSTITGQIKVADPSGTQIVCIELDNSEQYLRGAEETPISAVKRLLEHEDVDVEPLSVTDGPVASNCGTSSDHLQNIQVTADGSTTTVTGTLDEAIPQFTTNVDLTVKASFIKVPIKMDIPVAITPAIPQGDLKATFTSTSSETELESGISVTVNGQVKATDANNQEIGCLQLTE